MYIIKNQNRVFLGPKIWNRDEFQRKIFTEAGINFPLQWANPNEKMIVVNDEISIWPVDFRDDPEINKRTEFLDGPFYDYDEETGRAEHYMVAADMTVELAIANLKDAIKDARKHMINRGISITINDTNYHIKSDISAFANGIPGNWLLKRIDSSSDGDIPGTYVYDTTEVWVTLTQDDLDSIVSTLKTHIQTQFDSEKIEFERVEALTTLEEIKNHVLNPPQIESHVGRVGLF